MYVPGRYDSMLRDGERPVEFNPFADIQECVGERVEIIQREIDELREILSKPRHACHARRRDD